MKGMRIKRLVHFVHFYDLLPITRYRPHREQENYRLNDNIRASEKQNISSGVKVKIYKQQR